MALIYETSWVQTTGITPEEAAQRAEEMFNLYLDSGNDGECGDMACCCNKPTLHRIDPETGRPQISTDDGVTWTPDPADIQNQIQKLPPTVGDGLSKTKCDAATNASEHINELIEATSTNIGTAGDIFTLMVAVAEAALALMVFLVTGGAASPIILAFATAVWAAGSAAFSLGKDGFDTYWTTDKKDAILCALYCNIGDNGQFTESQYQAFRAKVKSQLPASPALDIVMTSINAGGAVGLSNMASYGNAADADCSSCECDTSLHVFVSDLVNPYVEIFPDGDGYYNVTQSGTPTGDGYYWVSFIFKNPFDGVNFAPCAHPHDQIGGGSDIWQYRCHDGVLDPLATCVCAYGIRNTTTGGWTVRIKFDQCT